MRRNIDAWWPHIEAGAEAIVISASGAVVKEYGHLLKDDARYAQKAARVAELAKDISEVLRDETLPWERIRLQQKKIAFHSSCTLQHGQQLDGVVEGILRKAGFKLTPVADAHLCCGSAGTYSILQAELSQQLLSNKLQALQAGEPDSSPPLTWVVSCIWPAGRTGRLSIGSRSLTRRLADPYRYSPIVRALADSHESQPGK